MLDVDHTLSPPDSIDMFDGVDKWLDGLKKKNIKIILISNNNEKRLSVFSAVAKISAYIFNAHKPLPYKVKKELHRKKENVLMVGDQILTDILMANLAGYRSILVNPQSKDPDRMSFKFKRFFEKIVKNKMQKCVTAK